jgi:hypothetical protein
MALSILPMLVELEEKFIRAPGTEEVEEVYYPGERALTALAEGSYEFLSSGLVTLIVLPVLATILYRTGFRVAGPLLALLTLGLFLSRILNTPA